MSIIEIQNLTKTFGAGDAAVHALSDVSLTVEKGGIFGIIGLSGAGKSTLVRCMNRLEKPDSGHVIIDGVDITDLSEAQLIPVRRSMSMIFQGFNLLSQSTVIDNVCFPLLISGVSRREARSKAASLLETVGLAGREKAYPAQLSGGMQQRVAIARALSTDPRVLLCDEATSALDPSTTAGILELLKRINAEMGITIVIITHEMSVIERICDHVVILDKSRVAEAGAVEKVFADPRSDIAKELIFASGRRREVFSGRKCVRIVFDGRSAFEPVIADLVLACGAAVNILFADTKTIGNAIYGQMVLQLPDDSTASTRIIKHLDQKGVRYSFEEAKQNV